MAFWWPVFYTIYLGSVCLIFLALYFYQAYPHRKAIKSIMNDMCKAVDRGMLMGDAKLLEKSGAWIAEMWGV